MANEGNRPHSRGMPFEQAYEIKRDKAIIELEKHVRKLTRKLKQIQGSEQRNHYHRGLDVSHIGIAYLSPHKDCDDED